MGTSRDPAGAREYARIRQLSALLGLPEPDDAACARIIARAARAAGPQYQQYELLPVSAETRTRLALLLHPGRR